MCEVEFRHGALSASYEEQANEQGYTFGDKADFVEDVGFGLVCAHIHGVITDTEYDKILQRFQRKVLIPNLRRISGND